MLTASYRHDLWAFNVVVNWSCVWIKHASYFYTANWSCFLRGHYDLSWGVCWGWAELKQHLSSEGCTHWGNLYFRPRSISQKFIQKKKNQNSAFNFFLVKVTHLIIEQVTLPFFSFLKEWVLLCFSLRTVLEWEHTEFIYLFIHSFFKKQGCLLYILNVSQGFTLGCFSKQFLLQI